MDNPYGGAGGAGRIHIEYCQSFTGATSPSANAQKLTCYVTEQVEVTPYGTGRLNLPENVTGNKTYQVQYARRLNFTGASSQVTTLRVPAGMLSTATLQALISQLPANASYSIDIGNNGVNDWSGTATNISTNTSSDLAAAFNAYWVAQGAPATGIVDVPVKVTMSQASQVLLTNLQMTTAGSKQRMLRLSAGTVSTATLDIALGGSGEKSISVAVDVGADGSLDWTSSVSTTLPVRLTTGNVASAINSYLIGKIGLVDIPLRIYIAPDLPVALYDANIKVQPAVDLAAGGLNAGASVAASGAGQIDNSAYLEGAKVPVQATISNPSSTASGPVTAAFFATAEGWGDWYIGSAFVADIAAGGSEPVNIVWDTTGFSGNVPVKVMVNPYGRTGETSTSNNMQVITVTVTPLNPPPAADFAATPTIGGAPLTVQFTSTVTNTVTAYAWEFGDGQSSTEANPTHLYTASGVYTVKLTVSGPGGSTDKLRSSYVEVTTTPTVPTAAFSATVTTGVTPLTVLFGNQSTGTVSGWLWGFGDGATSTAANPTHQYTAAGGYTVALTASGPGGSDTETKTQYIQATAPTTAPVADFSASPTTGKTPLAVQFTDASTGTITSWVWSFGDGATSTTQSPSHQYAAIGNYTVALTVIGPNGSDTETKAQYIQVVAPPVAAFSASPGSGAAPLSVLFSDLSTGIITAWVWDFGDGATSSQQNPVHEYKTQGTYTVRLTVSGPGGSNTTTQSDLIQVDDQAVPPTARFTVTPTIGAAPLPVQFTDGSTGTITAWSWGFGDGQTSTERNPAHTYTAAGIYTATLTASGPAGSSSKSQQMRVTPPVPAFLAKPPDGGGMTVQFTFTIPDGVDHWLWDFGDGQTSSEQNPVHVYAAPGNYTVTLTVFGPDGLSTSREMRVEVKGSDPVGPPTIHLYLPAVQRR